MILLVLPKNSTIIITKISKPIKKVKENFIITCNTPHWYNLVRKFYMEVKTLKITLNLDTNEIIVPKNFFKNKTL